MGRHADPEAVDPARRPSVLLGAVTAALLVVLSVLLAWGPLNDPVTPERTHTPQTTGTAPARGEPSPPPAPLPEAPALIPALQNALDALAPAGTPSTYRVTRVESDGAHARADITLTISGVTAGTIPTEWTRTNNTWTPTPDSRARLGLP